MLIPKGEVIEGAEIAKLTTEMKLGTDSHLFIL